MMRPMRRLLHHPWDIDDLKLPKRPSILQQVIFCLRTDRQVLFVLLLFFRLLLLIPMIKSTAKETVERHRHFVPKHQVLMHFYESRKCYSLIMVLHNKKLLFFSPNTTEDINIIRITHKHTHSIPSRYIRLKCFHPHWTRWYALLITLRPMSRMFLRSLQKLSYVVGYDTRSTC